MHGCGGQGVRGVGVPADSGQARRRAAQSLQQSIGQPARAGKRAEGMPSLLSICPLCCCCKHAPRHRIPEPHHDQSCSRRAAWAPPAAHPCQTPSPRRRRTRWRPSPGSTCPSCSPGCGWRRRRRWRGSRPPPAGYGQHRGAHIWYRDMQAVVGACRRWVEDSKQATREPHQLLAPPLELRNLLWTGKALDHQETCPGKDGQPFAFGICAAMARGCLPRYTAGREHRRPARRRGRTIFLEPIELLFSQRHCLANCEGVRAGAVVWCAKSAPTERGTRSLQREGLTAVGLHAYGGGSRAEH